MRSNLMLVYIVSFLSELVQLGLRRVHREPDRFLLHGRLERFGRRLVGLLRNRLDLLGHLWHLDGDPSSSLASVVRVVVRVSVVVVRMGMVVSLVGGRGDGRRSSCSSLADATFDVEMEGLDDERLALLLEGQVVLTASAADEGGEFEGGWRQRMEVEGPMDVNESMVMREQVWEGGVRWRMEDGRGSASRTGVPPRRMIKPTTKAL